MLTYRVLVVTFFFNCLFCSSNHVLVPDVPVTFELAPNSQTPLLKTNPEGTSGYAVFQAHTQFKNVTLSLSSDKQTSENSETGTNVGIVVTIAGQTTLEVFLVSRHNVTVNVLLSVSVYKDVLYPVPGGCNIEFNMENDPNMRVSFDSYISHVEFQYARGAVNDSRCERSPALYAMSYHLYVYYISRSDLSEESYLTSMKKMLNKGSIMEHGTKVKEFKYTTSQKPVFSLPAYTGQGSIYSLVVMFKDKMAAYVPVATYSCDLYDNDKSSCRYSSTLAKVLITVAGVVGAFLWLFGHRFFKTGLWLISTCGFCAMFYVILHLGTSMSFAVYFVLACVLAAVTGSLWLTLWWCLGQPVISVLVPGMTAGYVIASVVFYTPFGNLHYWSTKYNYGMCFSVAVLLIPVLLLYWTKLLNILSCAFIGSFLIVMALDVWLDTGIKYIMINTFRHAYVDQYRDVLVPGPCTTLDLILFGLWLILFVIGAAIQFYFARGRPDFPQCPRSLRKRRLQQEDASFYSNRQQNDNERAPLLSNVLDHNYAATRNSSDGT